MRVTPDAQLFTALARESVSRDSGGRRRNSEDVAAFSRQASISGAYGRAVATPEVSPGAKQQNMAESKDRSAADTSTSRREAPMGQRPKFIPKGQTINLLV